jgi:hypothetical protein
MLISFITRSDVPAFLMRIGFSDVPPTLTFPRAREYEGVTDILGVCEWAGNAKAENRRTNRLENRTNDFNFIRFTPIFYLPVRYAWRRHMPINWFGPKRGYIKQYLYQGKGLLRRKPIRKDNSCKIKKLKEVYQTSKWCEKKNNTLQWTFFD